MAGLAGALYGTVQQVVGTSDFDIFPGIIFVLFVTIWSIRTVSGAFLAALTYVVLNQVWLNGIGIFAGVGIILIGRAASGILGIEALQIRLPWVKRSAESVRAEVGPRRVARRRSSRAGPVPPAEVPDPGTTPSSPSRSVAVRFGGRGRAQRRQPDRAPGTVTGLIGPNGAGKTTLFNVISGLQTPDRGSVHLFDTDITAMKPHRRARLGLARTFQRLELFGTLTAGENVQVGLESTVKWWQWRRLRRSFPWKRGRTASAADGRPIDRAGPGSIAVATSDRLLDGVGLGGLGDRAGQSPCRPALARMVELARALAIGPKLLLLDEPGSGLDEAESAALGRAAVTLAAGGMAVLAGRARHGAGHADLRPHLRPRLRGHHRVGHAR